MFISTLYALSNLSDLVNKMSSGGPPANGGGATHGTNGKISTEAAVAALEQHDTLFHRQVMHLRQQQVIQLIVTGFDLIHLSLVLQSYSTSETVRFSY